MGTTALQTSGYATRMTRERLLGRHSVGRSLLGQAKVALILYPSLFAVAFVGAIAAAYINPHLLDPVEVEPSAQVQPTAAPAPTILTPQPLSTVPVEPSTGASEPLISMFGTGRPTTSTPVSIVNHGEATASAMATRPAAGVPGEQCEPQRTVDGHYLGRTCTPIPVTVAPGGR